MIAASDRPAAERRWIDTALAWYFAIVRGSGFLLLTRPLVLSVATD